MEQAVSKVRAELMNRITEGKNEHARKEAEWQRAQTKHSQAVEERLEEARQQLQQEHLKELKEAKGVVERMWKKKLDE